MSDDPGGEGRWTLPETARAPTSGDTTTSAPPPPCPQPYSPPPGHWPGHPPLVDRPQNGLAVAALVCAIASVVIFPAAVVGLILGIVALVQLRGSRTHERGLAIAAVAVSGVMTLVMILFVALVVAWAPGDGVFDDRPYVSELEVGECIEALPAILRDDDDDRSLVDPVECTQPHRAQVFDVVSLTTGPYPGEDAVLREGTRDCERLAPRAVTADVAAGRARIAVAYPGSAAWGYSRTAHCLVVSSESRSTGYDTRAG